VSFFYEIRSTTDTVLKRTGGFVDREAATVAAREDGGWQALSYFSLSPLLAGESYHSITSPLNDGRALAGARLPDFGRVGV